MTSPSIKEKVLSRPLAVGASSKHSRQCIVFDATSESQAVASMIADTATFPASYSTVQAGVTYNFVRGNVGVDPIDDGRDPSTTWEGSVEYVLQGSLQNSPPYQTGDSVKAFEIGVQSVNVKQNPHSGGTSIFPRVVSGTPQPFVDFKGLINVTTGGGSSSVGGVDLDFPTFAWSETHYVADADVTTAYANAVYAVAVNPINDDTFRDLAAGEVKFLGLQGSRRGSAGDWELNFRFAAAPNKVLTIGDIPSIAKKGWDYLWFHYKLGDSIGDGSSTYSVTKMVANAAYVEDVYGSSDFSTLGIGT